MNNSILAKLQKLGKALMLPIAVLPIAGLLLRFGQGDLLNMPILAQAGSSLFDNLPMLFAIGIAIGLAEDNHGAAGLAGAISFYVLNAASQQVNYALQAHTIIANEAYVAAQTVGFTDINLAHFGGIVAGIIAGLCYNKFHNIKLPDWLGFFGGRRFVPIITGLVSLIIAIPFGILWPYAQSGLDSAAVAMTSAAAVGAFFYGLLNRLLIPFGLHHVINTFVWFNFGTYTDPATGAITTGDLNRFFAGDPAGGLFTAGFFPIMMFALPAAALAMYVCAKKENKASTGGALFSVAFTAFLCGITEPIEFMFMFLAPVLYGIHAVLMGLSLAVCTILGVHDSFTFSAGAIDYLLNLGIATKPFMIIILGIIFGALYFFLFVFFIKKFDIKTPGREDDEELATNTGASVTSDKSLSDMAASYISLLGGKENIQEIESCITRIRLVLKDNTNVDEKALKAVGAAGVMKANKNVTQVVVGTKAELIVDEMKKLLK